jgi:hypothetical protein
MGQEIILLLIFHRYMNPHQCMNKVKSSAINKVHFQAYRDHYLGILHSSLSVFPYLVCQLVKFSFRVDIIIPLSRPMKS